MCIRDSKISAREAIESQYSLDSVKDEDGNYPAPSADAVLSYVRNRILLEEASKQGIEPVSYTHLDVYKRQPLSSGVRTARRRSP